MVCLLWHIPRVCKMSVVRAWKAGKNSSCCFTLMMMLQRVKGHFWVSVSLYESHTNNMSVLCCVQTCQCQPLPAADGIQQRVQWKKPVWPPCWRPQQEEPCCLTQEHQHQLNIFSSCVLSLLLDCWTNKEHNEVWILAEGYLAPGHLGGSSWCWSSLPAWCRPRSCVGTLRWGKWHQTASGSGTPWSPECIELVSWAPLTPHNTHSFTS